MPPTNDWISWLERLSGAGLGVLASIALVGSYFGIWLWGRQHREHVAELKQTHATEIAELRAQVAKTEAARQRWEDMALGLLNVSERVTDDRLARKR